MKSICFYCAVHFRMRRELKYGTNNKIVIYRRFHITNRQLHKIFHSSSSTILHITDFSNISVTKSNSCMRFADTKSNYISYTYFSMKVAERGLFSISGRRLSSRILSSCVSRRPGPMEVVTTEFTSHINDFANEIEPGHVLRFHGL